ncbi:MAG: porin family protein [Bacteroidota bacterium]
MKNLLRISIALLFVTFSFQSYSQLRYGPKVGLNFAKQKVEFDGKTSDDIKSRVSFAIGGVADYAFTDELSLQPSLMLSGKGYKVDMSFDGESATAWQRLYYLELPINVVYKYDIGVLKIYGTAGPTFALAIGGSSKVEVDGKTETEKIKFGDGDDDDGIKRGDFGLNFGAGVEISSFQFELNYNFGLMNTSYDDNSSAKNRVFSLSASYFFGDGF